MDNYKIHQIAVITPHPTNESDEDDFDYGAFQFHQTGSSTTTPPWANGSWSQTDQSRQGQWQYFGWEHDPSEYHTVATFVHKDHSLETVGHNWHYWWKSWPTPHYSKQFVSFFFSCESSISCMSKRARETFASSASAKQKPVHCSGLTARKNCGKNADMDFHAVLPPVY